MLLNFINCAMERIDVIYWVVILFVILLSILFFVDFKAKQLLAKDNECDEHAKLLKVKRFLNSVNLFGALTIVSVAVNHFQASVYTMESLVLSLILGIYTLYLCITLRQKRLTVSVVLKLSLLVLFYILVKQW